MRLGLWACRLGASIIWHGNQYVRELAAVAGLKTKQPGPGGSSGASRLSAIYDGRELIFRESSWSLLTALRLFFRWGLAWWRFSSQPKAVAQQFGALYAALDAGTPWDSPGEMLEALGLRQLTEANLVGVALHGACLLHWARRWLQQQPATSPSCVPCLHQQQAPCSHARCSRQPLTP